jgi:N-acyl-D-aspartate/D-glutamate deacylase
VNLGCYLPMNPLLSYVMGPEDAKQRPASAEERRRMRELLHEAMDAGAIGFSFSYLGIEGNSHVDFDQSPMPSDVMAQEEAFNLCDVLRERSEGVIQLLADMPATGAPKREFCEELARRSGRPVLHNVTVVVPGHPELHRSTLDWLDDCGRRGLDVWTQLGTGRVWFEFNVMDYNGWDSIPVFRALGASPSPEGRLAIVRSAEYRERLRREYDPFKMLETGSTLENYYLHDAGGAEGYAAEQGCQLGEIARRRDVGMTDLFLDLLSESDLRAEFRVENVTSHDAKETGEVLRHPKVIAGLSDGGAHGKFTSGGQWAVDVIMWLVRESGEFELEELHQILSQRTCRAFGFADRGTIEVGKAADLFIYDLEALNFDRGRFDVLHDLPGGEWRRCAPARGVSYMVTNGEVTFDHGACSGATPGLVLRNTHEVAAASPHSVAAE